MYGLYTGFLPFPLVFIHPFIRFLHPLFVVSRLSGQAAAEGKTEGNTHPEISKTGGHRFPDFKICSCPIITIVTNTVYYNYSITLFFSDLFL